MTDTSIVKKNTFDKNKKLFVNDVPKRKTALTINFLESNDLEVLENGIVQCHFHENVSSCALALALHKIDVNKLYRFKSYDSMHKYLQHELVEKKKIKSVYHLYKLISSIKAYYKYETELNKVGFSIGHGKEPSFDNKRLKLQYLDEVVQNNQDVPQENIMQYFMEDTLAVFKSRAKTKKEERARSFHDLANFISQSITKVSERKAYSNGVRDIVKIFEKRISTEERQMIDKILKEYSDN